MDNHFLQNLREEYMSELLDTEQVNSNPFHQFNFWFKEAINAGVAEPNAMTLATATPEAIPSARIVLLKGYDENGFVFFTNYESRKSEELLENPNAAAVFWWGELARQIRIEGSVKKVDTEISTGYFQSRPRGSQIGAWASPQSRIIKNREILEDRVRLLEKEYEGIEKLPKPEHWGSFVISPTVFEFWQGRSSRLHDRIRYQLTEDKWVIERLAP